MSGIRTAAGVVGGLGLTGVLVGGVVVGAGAVWVKVVADAALTRTYETHAVDFPVPFPLEEAELAELGAGVDPVATAEERAIERGRHLVEARYACGQCHGHDFGGSKMIDDPLIGRMFAPNLTTGPGSRTLAYTPTDWDRMVRHGVKPDGMATVMPSEDFAAMTDRELSDIVTYVRSLPPVDAQIARLSYGPLGLALIATGQIQLSAAVHPDHHASHAVLPPAEAPDAAFGKHIAQACSGCHRSDFTGGPIVGGDPSWPPAGDLTALGEWTYADFVTALREGRRPDGTALRSPMAEMQKMAANMSETELRAMWAFLQTLPGTAADGPDQG